MLTTCCFSSDTLSLELDIHTYSQNHLNVGECAGTVADSLMYSLIKKRVHFLFAYGHLGQTIFICGKIENKTGKGFMSLRFSCKK